MLKLLLGLSPSVIALGSALLAGGASGYAGYRVGHWTGYRSGVKVGGEAMAVAVEKQNAKAGEAARAVKRTVDGCFDAGGDWNQERGECDK